jgi:hypothetical protein
LSGLGHDGPGQVRDTSAGALEQTGDVVTIGRDPLLSVADER